MMGISPMAIQKPVQKAESKRETIKQIVEKLGDTATYEAVASAMHAWDYRINTSLTNPNEMNEKEKAQYREKNQKFLMLTAEQCDMHYDIVHLRLDDLPESLRKFCGEQASQYGIYGDSMACWIADWIKAGNVWVDPLADESDEDYEKGRLEAIKLLGGTVPENTDPRKRSGPQPLLELETT